MFAGIVDFKRLKALLDGEYLGNRFEGDLKELEERFFRGGVLDSVATALWLYVNEDCDTFLRVISILPPLSSSNQPID
ncbi:hypothetical protein [Vulcanisaeta souniana]|uniref:hypothetical protein n=1 Tax=Vulcanisaeta souniana TaxID=164452 RepID=UPI0006D02608|nr:hypothetical protein [Vulcanisaeta souniana]